MATEGSISYSSGGDMKIEAAGNFTGRDSTHITHNNLNLNRLIEIMQDNGEADAEIEELIKQALVLKEGKKETQLFDTVTQIMSRVTTSLLATWLTKTLIG